MDHKDILKMTVAITYAMSANLFDDIYSQGKNKVARAAQQVAEAPGVVVTFHIAQRGVGGSSIRIERSNAESHHQATYTKQNPLVVRGDRSDILTIKDTATGASRSVSLGQLVDNYGVQIGLTVVRGITRADGSAPAEIILMRNL